MTGGAGFVEFFVLEASDYVEQLDGLLLKGGATGPDAGALQRVARALRGSATMAKLRAFAELAGSVEGIGRAIQQGALRWDPALGGQLVSAIDDLKILLHSVRAWSAADDQRAQSRVAELSRYAPASAPTPPIGSTPSRATTGPNAYFATEAANIAAGLELLTTRASDAETAANVLRRIRALRGVAGLAAIAPLAEVLETTEDAARHVESTSGPMSPEARQLIEAAAAHLRTLSSALRSGGDVNAPSSSRDAFASALDGWGTTVGERERIVPIAELFYGDEQPGLVEAATSPPTSAAERFRLEVVSLGEHLSQVVAAARRATDAASTARVRRDLKRALRALHASAMSFNENDIAAAIDRLASEVDTASDAAFRSLEELSTALHTSPDAASLRERLAARPVERVERVERVPEAAPVADRPTPSAAPVADEAIPPVVAQRMKTPAIASSAATLLDSTIAALDGLSSQSFAPAIDLPEDAVVPIATLLYQGRAALDRAVEIRDQLRAAGGSPDHAALDELFDLLDLARAE